MLAEFYILYKNKTWDYEVADLGDGNFFNYEDNQLETLYFSQIKNEDREDIECVKFLQFVKNEEKNGS
jgi:hypothetical protein